MAATVIGRIPLDYNDRFGEYTPTEKDLARLDEEIAKKLPDNVNWCCDELLAEMKPGETLDEIRERFDCIDIEAILEEAYEGVMEMIN